VRCGVNDVLAALAACGRGPKVTPPPRSFVDQHTHTHTATPILHPRVSRPGAHNRPSARGRAMGNGVRRRTRLPAGPREAMLLSRQNQRAVSLRSDDDSGSDVCTAAPTRRARDVPQRPHAPAMRTVLASTAEGTERARPSHTRRRVAPQLAGRLRRQPLHPPTPAPVIRPR